MSRATGTVLLLPALLVLEWATAGSFAILVSLALPVLLVVNIVTAVLLAQASRRAPEIVSLRARADDAVFLGAAAAAAAVMGTLVIARAFGAIQPVPREVFLVGISYALIVLSAPAVNWLVVWKPWREEVTIPDDD